MRHSSLDRHRSLARKVAATDQVASLLLLRLVWAPRAHKNTPPETGRGPADCGRVESARPLIVPRPAGGRTAEPRCRAKTMSDPKSDGDTARALIPMLVCRDAASEIDFCKAAFGA